MSSFFNIENEKRFETPKLPGITVGVVSDIGTESDGNLGKVRVRLLNMENSNYKTDYIRVMTPLTSSMRFIPEVGDEVLVAFCEGDMSQPYVLGCLHKANVQQPQTNDSLGTVADPGNHIKTIKTRSGHEITFVDYEAKDKAGKDKSNGYVDITSAGGLMVSLDDAENKILLSAESGNGKYNEVIISANDGTISINASKKIELCVGESKIEIGDIVSAIDNATNQKSSINIKAQSNVNLKGTGAISTKSNTLKVDSNTSLELESKGSTQLKGINTFIKGNKVNIN